MNEKNKDLLRKVRALAERGTGGEQDNARRLLEKLLQKYNASEADLSDDALEDHFYTYHNAIERKLLLQVVDKVRPEARLWRYTSGTGCRSQLGVTCTARDAVQIQIEYDFFRELMQDELDLFFEAFVQKHRIFNSRPGHVVTTVDSEKFQRLAAMMAGMQDRDFVPQIEGR